MTSLAALHNTVQGAHLGRGVDVTEVTSEASYLPQNSETYQENTITLKMSSLFMDEYIFEQNAIVFGSERVIK